MQRLRSQHHRAITWAILVSISLTLWPMHEARAQLAVADASNLVQNTMTAMNSVETAMSTAETLEETLTLVKDSAKQLAAYTKIGKILTMVGHLRRLVSQMETVSSRMGGRLEFWNSLSIPNSVESLGVFRGNANGLCRLASLDALGLQGLIGQITAILATITDLLADVADITGSTAGLQATAGGINSLNASIGALAGMQSGVNEESICRSLTENTERQAMNRIGTKFYSDWGAYTRP